MNDRMFLATGFVFESEPEHLPLKRVGKTDARSRGTGSGSTTRSTRTTEPR